MAGAERAVLGGRVHPRAWGSFLPLIYLTYSAFRGRPAGPNPWGAYGLEWETTSPPPTANFEVTPIVTKPAYYYAPEEH